MVSDQADSENVDRPEDEKDRTVTRELDLELEWLGRMISASRTVKPRIDEQLQMADLLFAEGFASFAIVAAWTAFEVYSGEVIVRSILGALTWPYDELGTFLFDSIFGRNGRLGRLKEILRKVGTLKALYLSELEGPERKGELIADPFSDDLWNRLERIQVLRNSIVHTGDQATQDQARWSIDSLRRAIGEVEKYLEFWSPYVEAERRS